MNFFIIKVHKWTHSKLRNHLCTAENEKKDNKNVKLIVLRCLYSPKAKLTKITSQF